MKQFTPAPHIQYLLKLEDETRGQYRGNIRFDRTSTGIVVSCEGYNHMALVNDAEGELLKLGCRYDFERGVQQFDRMCGRTFTYFKEPKRGAR